MNRFKKNFLAMVRNSAEGKNHMFQNYFIELDGEELDALKGGALACSAYVSALLFLQNPGLKAMKLDAWLDSTHANVVSTEKDMEAHGWHEIPELREGAVITWEEKPGVGGALHWHQGFYLGDERAISNGSNTTLVPEEHHYTYDDSRKIVRIWWHDALDEEE